MTDYSAGLTSKLFWLRESRKTASLMQEGKDRTAVKAIVWEEDINQVKAKYRAVEVLNATYRQVNLPPEKVRAAFIKCDIETAKIINLVAVMLDSRLAEIRLYDEAIAHVASQRIPLDLDDGVKMNYAKFQGVEVSREDMKTVKVDLLAKI